MVTRFTTHKTVVEGRLELLQFLQEAFHIAGDYIKGGNGKAFVSASTDWDADCG
jgi:hypothetical protein